MRITLTRDTLLDIEIECLKECANAIEMDNRPFTESERLHYNALEAIQALRKYKEKAEPYD